MGKVQKPRKSNVRVFCSSQTPKETRSRGGHWYVLYANQLCADLTRRLTSSVYGKCSPQPHYIISFLRFSLHGATYSTMWMQIPQISTDQQASSSIFTIPDTTPKLSSRRGRYSKTAKQKHDKEWPTKTYTKRTSNKSSWGLISW